MTGTAPDSRRRPHPGSHDPPAMESTMPVSFPIMRAPPCMRARVPARWAWAMAPASASAASACSTPQAGSRRRPCLNLLLAGMARADHAFLDVVGRIFRDLQPRLRRRQQRDGAGMADLERRGRILVQRKPARPRWPTGGCSAITFRQRRCSASSRSPSPSAARVVITPCATWLSREPDTAITPQPMRARPGSRPRMRIGALIGLLYPLCSTLS